MKSFSLTTERQAPNPRTSASTTNATSNALSVRRDLPRLTSARRLAIAFSLAGSRDRLGRILGVYTDFFGRRLSAYRHPPGGNLKDSLVCPSCKRQSITRRDIFCAPLDGAAQCRACGQLARLDLLGRWALSSLIALVLPSVLLYGDIFYSGHLFVFSVFFVLAAWRLLCVIAFPLLSLEAVSDRTPIGRKQSVFLAATMLIAMLSIDGFMASKFENGEGYADAATENLKR